MRKTAKTSTTHHHGWDLLQDDHHRHRELALLKDEVFLNVVADTYLAKKAELEARRAGGESIPGNEMKPFCCHLWGAVNEELRRSYKASLEHTGMTPITHLDLAQAARIDAAMEN